jgi:hypothetical protein
VSLASDLLDQASTLAGLDPMKPKQASNMAIHLSRHRQVSVYLLTFLRPGDGQR